MILSLTEIYRKLGGDLTTAIDTFGDEDMLKTYIDKFMSETTYSKFVEAFEASDYEVVFKTTHTLKGITGYLGLTRLYDHVKSLCEMTRPGHEERRIVVDMEREAQAIKEEYARVISLFSN